MTELETKIRRLIADYRMVDPAGAFVVRLHPDDYRNLPPVLTTVSLVSDPKVSRGVPVIKPVGKVTA